MRFHLLAVEKGALTRLLIAINLIPFICSVSSCDAPEPLPSARNAVLITIDTLRPDRLTAYDANVATSPQIAAFASQSILYANAYAHSAWTTPSHASMMTGLLPPEHGVRDLWRDRVSDATTTIAELLQARRFDTAAFVSSVVLRSEVGFDQGFAVYDEGAVRAFTERYAPNTTNAFLKWLDSPRDGRFFAWIHLFDPHAPYRAHESYDEVARQRDEGIPVDLTGERADEVRRYRYDSEVHHVDCEFGRIVDALKRQGLYEDTVIVVTSDHGELLGEGDQWLHRGVSETVLRIPLILKPAGADAGGLEIDQRVRQIDVFPTLLEMLDVEVPPTEHARLLPPFEASSEDRPLYAEHSKTGQYALIEAEWKLVGNYSTEAGTFESYELYNLYRDPREAIDLAAEEGARVQSMKKRLTALARLGGATAAKLEVSEDIGEKLRSLGYSD